MKIASVQAMQAMDLRTIQELGLPSMVLMERAALGMAQVIQRDYVKALGQIHILAGTGNNGGDGLALARILANQGIPVQVWLWGQDEHRSSENRQQLSLLEHLNMPLRPLQSVEQFQEGIQTATLLVDCLFGIGLNRPLTEMTAELVTVLNQSPRPVVAADIPSGLQGDTGCILGTAVKADCTVTFGFIKNGLLMDPALDYVGQLICIDIGIPQAFGQNLPGNRNDIAALLPYVPLKRPASAHKGTYGKTLILAGSTTMSGAAVMAAKAALRSGVGLVFLMVPEPIHSIVASQIPAVQVLPLPVEQGQMTAAGMNLWLAKAAQCQSLLVGPGLGVSPQWPAFLATVLAEATCPVVLDADGLNNLQGQTLDVKSPLIITPHVGELSRWTGYSSQYIQQNRHTVACEAAASFNAITVLKGGNAIIAQPDGQYWINQTGNPGMARGGSGDILAGLLAGLLAQGIPPLAATRLAVYWHGLAGDCAAAQRNQTCMGVAEILANLPKAYTQMTTAEIEK